MHFDASNLYPVNRLFAVSTLALTIVGCSSDNNDNGNKSFSTISEIQQQSKADYDDEGNFVQSPIDGKTFTVSGVVTALAPRLNLDDYQGDEVCKGVYFIQTADQVTKKPATSNGLMICNNSKEELATEFTVGDAVEITGEVYEVYSETQLRITSSDDTIKLDNTGWQATPHLITDDITLDDIHNLYEGMLIQLANNTWYITDNYNFGRYGEIELAKGSPLWKPTNLYPAESHKAVAEQLKNDNSRLIIDDGISSQNTGDFTYYPEFSAEHPIRVGNTADSVIGVARYAYGKVQVIPTVDITFGEGISPRRAPPERQESQLRVASMNVLNYFNGLYISEGKVDFDESEAIDANGNQHESRGADSAELFTRQKDKIINAITSMDADIVGLMEIENDGFGEHSAIQDLVDGLNDKSDREYTFVDYTGQDNGQIGTDAITTGLLYDKKTISSVGKSSIITLPTQHFINVDKEKIVQAQRPSFVQTFADNVSGTEFTIVVSHLKSKGSGCWEDEPENLVEDGQEHCNSFRISAVNELGKHLKERFNPDSDHLLLIGDFNAYTQEDPMLLLTNNDEAQRPLKPASHLFLDGKPMGEEDQELAPSFGYVNLMPYTQPYKKTYSYSYNGELGNLDHALASPAFLENIVNVQEWHINAAESNLLDYTIKYKPEDKLQSLYVDNAFRSSDHDPLVIDISFANE